MRDERKHFYSLVKAMTIQDIKVRYKHAVLGFLWVILTPVLQMFIISVLFSLIIKTPVENYHVFLFSGLLLWNFFAMSLGKAASSIVDQRSIITKAKFPSEVVPTSIVLSNFFHYVVSSSLLACWVLIFEKVSFLLFLLIPLTLIWIFLLTLGCSLLLSSYHVRFRDISYVLQIVLQVLFYATPILYPLHLLPEHYQSFFVLNPLTGPVMMMQYIYGQISLPSVDLLLLNFLLTILLFILGGMEFRRLSRNFDDWV